ncbi:MAG TPA: ABC transporter permease [Verrucomicrobiae bacterium]
MSHATDTPSAATDPATEQWDLVMRPKTGWFDLHLSDLWRYRDLTMLFVWRDFVAQYKQTILGPLWHIIQPLFTTLMFVLMGGVASLPTDGLPPVLFYMAGITCWNYFAECLTRSSGTFIQNASIFGKVYFPRLCVPVSIVISNIIKFGIQFGLFLGFMAYFYAKGAPIHPNALMLLTPLLVLIMAALGLGAGIIVSALTIRYRDLQVLITFGVQLLMFATVLLPLSKFPEKYHWLVLANPMLAIIETFRFAFLGAGTFAWSSLAYSLTATTVILFIGILLFNHVERTFMDTV